MNFRPLLTSFQWLIPMLKPKPVFLEFPPMDLTQHLVDCYFDNINVVTPILHRPSFVRSIQQGLHEVDQAFGAVVLLVCAIGCRFTNDPRVVQTISPNTSCTAWKFFHQANSIQKHQYLPHSLHEAQIYPVCPPVLFKLQQNNYRKSWRPRFSRDTHRQMRRGPWSQ